MTLLLAMLSRAWPFLLAAALGAAIGGWTTHGVDTIALNRQKAAYAGYQAKVADAEAVAQKAAREALQAQIDERHTADVNNAQVMNDLKKRTADAESHYAADRDFIQRMLNSASSNPAPPSSSMLAAHDKPGPPAAGETGRTEAVALCVDTKLEDQGNADNLDALIAQLKPQLEKRQ